ncbi:MAG TPA: hypothetical protein VGH22_06930 [Candidatus Binatia bacterium]|jgi:hypothetical protein
MEPTEWDFRNKLLAVLSAARHKGMPYVDVESRNLVAELGGGSKKNLRIPKCHEIMTRMMRPGDAILEETQNGDRATLLVRYVLNAKREN